MSTTPATPVLEKVSLRYFSLKNQSFTKNCPLDFRQHEVGWHFQKDCVEERNRLYAPAFKKSQLDSLSPYQYVLRKYLHLRYNLQLNPIIRSKNLGSKVSQEQRSS